MNKIIPKIRKLITPELLRYLTLAVILVGVEVVTFIIMLHMNISYLIATPVSMIIAIILNWYFSSVFVFQHRPHPPLKEFMLVAAASALGLLLQLAVTIAVVQGAHGAPLTGKLLAICVTFFWNFWFRNKYIFYKRTIA